MAKQKYITDSVSLFIGYSLSDGIYGASGTVSFLTQTNVASTIVAEISKLYHRIVDPSFAIRRIGLTCNDVQKDQDELQLNMFEDVTQRLLCRDSSSAKRVTELVGFIISTTPTVLFLMILYYVVFGSWNLSGIWVSVVAFSLLFGSAVHDMITDGIAAVGIQQYEGARALGYGKNQTLFHVLLPQAARHIFPRYKNEIIALIKETSIVGYIAVSDLTKMSDIVRNRTYEAFFPLISTAVIYFAITGMLIAFVKRIELKFDPKRRTQEQISSGIQIKEF